MGTKNNLFRSAAMAVLALLAAPTFVAAFPGLKPHHLDAGYWIAKAEPGAPVPFAAIAAQNAELVREDPAVHDLAELPGHLGHDALAELVQGLSSPPTRTLYDVAGKQLGRRDLAAIVRNAAVDRIPGQGVAPRWGLVVRRADMRTFPSTLRVFSSAGDTDIDRFQETALFPGTPLALLHESRDGQWWFARSPLYAAWIEKRHVAEGAREAVLGYGRRSPFLVVTGAEERTVYTPERPAVSELVLDMGVRVPLLADWPANALVNGQHPLGAHVIELPVRNGQGTLEFAPALLPRSAEVATAYLPLTRANLIRQAFRFLGERYGWGHSYGARDCSGFVSEVYRSFGIVLPRNTSQQAVSPAFALTAFGAGIDRAARIAVLRTLDVGDLVYIPGHVMMVIGQDEDGPYVIHSTTGTGVVAADGQFRRVPLNGVVVTPLLPLMADADTPYVDRITAIQRVRPVADAGDIDSTRVPTGSGRSHGQLLQESTE